MLRKGAASLIIVENAKPIGAYARLCGCDAGVYPAQFCRMPCSNAGICHAAAAAAVLTHPQHRSRHMTRARTTRSGPCMRLELYALPPARSDCRADFRSCCGAACRNTSPTCFMYADFPEKFGPVTIATAPLSVEGANWKTNKSVLACGSQAHVDNPNEPARIRWYRWARSSQRLSAAACHPAAVRHPCNVSVVEFSTSRERRSLPVAAGVVHPTSV